MANMGFLDSAIGKCFRNEKSGRVVVFPGDRAYLLRSEADEPKIRSFIKMFLIGQCTILLFGNFLASEWSRDIYHELGSPAAHLLRTMGIAFGVYTLVMGVPYLFLYRSYKKALFNFVSAQDQVQVSASREWQPRFLLIGIVVLTLGVLLAFLVSSK
jgi:hypothetical protein